MAGASGPCVFIAHRKKDRDKAVEVGRIIKRADIDIYLDEDDKPLQVADAAKDHQKVVEYIEAGLSKSTHFLGVITDNTVGSWWVPFEFGMAKNAGLACAHLITKEVKELPSFIQVSRILCNNGLVVAWVESLRPFLKEATTGKLNQLLTKLAVWRLPFLPPNRPLSDLKFVD